MAAASIAKTIARIAWLIGARNDSGTFNTTLGNENFILEELQRAAVETESEIAGDLANSKHPLAVSFWDWSADLANGDMIPAHLGEIEAIRIKKYSAASGYELAESTSRENIVRWRENHNLIFDALAHNVQNSSLSGFYNLTGQTITFTGHAAQAKIFTFDPDFATPAHQIPEQFEANIISGAIAKLGKLGVAENLIMHYANEYGKLKNALLAGHMQMPDVSILQKTE